MFKCRTYLKPSSFLSLIRFDLFIDFYEQSHVNLYTRVCVCALPQFSLLFPLPLFICRCNTFVNATQMWCLWYCFLFLAVCFRSTLPFWQEQRQENSEIFCSRNLMAYICHESFQSDWFLLSGIVKPTQPINPATLMALNSDNLISYVSCRSFCYFSLVHSGKNKER